MHSIYSVTSVAEKLHVSRQAVYKNRKGKIRMFYHRQEDPQVLELIRSVMEQRPTYGYKGITAMVNRIRGDQSRYNKKRIYRIMRMNGLTLASAGMPRSNHRGTGKVMTLHSNTRWCSDAFEIQCFNRERVYVAFSLDCKDREALGYVAKKEPLHAQDIQDLMVVSVEKRFGQTRTPRIIQWLSDRGLIYRSKETQQIGRQLGLDPCFAAAYSPESNGMAEAFVKTFKRDYVYTHDCPSADQVIAQLGPWFEDYNHSPHSALDYKSPIEYQLLTNKSVN